MTKEFEDLFQTVEGVRKKDHKDVPGELVEQILKIEADYTEDRAEAAKRVIQAVDEFMKRSQS